MIFNLTRTQVRILFWGGFATLMVFVVLPFFFFFYLFNESQVKRAILDQFDNKNYHVEIAGYIAPKLWHGMSLDLTGIIVTAKNDDKLIQIKNISCKLSWLNLVIGRYRVKRIAINGVELEQKNLIHYGFTNFLNMSNDGNSLFSNLDRMDVYGVNTIGPAIYPINDGMFKIQQNGLGADFNLGFKLHNNQTYVMVNGSLNATNSDIINFDTFTMHIFNGTTNINLDAKASYLINNRSLSLQTVTGNLQVNNYLGTINLDKVELNVNGADMTNGSVQIDFANNFINHHVLFNINKLSTVDYKNLKLDKMSAQYTVDAPSVKLSVDGALQNVVYLESAGISSNLCTGQINFITPSLKDNGLNAILNGNLNNAPLNLDVQIFNNTIKPYVLVNGSIAKLDLSRVDLDKNKLMPLYNDTDKLPFSWLSFMNVKANLSIKAFALDRIALNNVVTSFDIKNDELDVSQLNADIYNGQLSGNLKIAKTNNGYNISAKQKVNNLNLKDMLGNLFDINAISGTSDVMLDATANSVNSYSDIHKKINGTVAMMAKNGAFQGVDFNLFVNPESSINLMAVKSTIFNHMQAKFNFVDGVSRNGLLQFSSPYVIANGIGVMNFVNNTLNYNLKIKSALPKNEQKISLVVIPVLVDGDILSPKISIQNIQLIGERSHSRKITRNEVKVLKNRHKEYINKKSN